MKIFNLKSKRNIYTIIPFKSVNRIEFGINRNEIFKKLGKPKKSFKKTSFAKTETDMYNNFHIYYDENYNFAAIEIFDYTDIYYNNDKLPKSYSELLEYFKTKYDDIEEDSNGFISKNGSIGVYIENDDDIIDAILFGKKDYYE